MSAYSVRTFGLTSALLATFFGGFLFSSAATITFTIDREATATFTPEEAHSFEVQVESGSGVIKSIGSFLEKQDGSSFPTVLSSFCGDADEDYSGDFLDVECVWAEGYEGIESVSFNASVTELGEYLLSVEVIEAVGGDDIEIFEDFSLTAAAAAATPLTFDSAATRDLDKDGKVDALKLTFSSEVDMDSVATDDISVDGYSVESVSAWDGENDSIKVVLTENALADSDAEPSVTVSGISGVTDSEVEATTHTANDESSPVMILGSIAENGDSIAITFSEDINETTLNKVSLDDFSLLENTVVAVDKTGAGVVTLTLGATTTAATIEVTVGEEDIDDLKGNATAEHTVTATAATDTTPIAIDAVGLTTSATSTDEVMVGDTVTLTFSLGEVASTTSISILDEDAISPSVNGTTYTATYTVDADTTAGAVTFSILVADVAGNETTSTAVTDGSSLTVVAQEENGGGGGGDGSIAFSIPLTAGDFNLVSLPVSPSDTAIASVLSDISGSVESVWTLIDSSWYVYYPDNPSFSNLTTMDAGYAYYIKVSSDVTLSGSGVVSGALRTLSDGWQMVGYLQPDADTTDTVSIDTAFSSVGLAGVAYSDLVKYDGGSFTSATEVDPGDGFFMYVTGGSVTLGLGQLN